MDELREVIARSEDEKRATEEVWQARVKAKDFEIAELRDILADNQVIAETKLHEARQRLTNA